MQTSYVPAGSDDLALALLMADTADALTLAVFTGEAVAFTPKPDGSPVTETDLAVEVALLDLVSRTRPEDGFLGEETGLSNQAPRLWIVDPIDGTQSFVAGGRAWGTLIALSETTELSQWELPVPPPPAADGGQPQAPARGGSAPEPPRANSASPRRTTSAPHVGFVTLRSSR